MDKAKQVHHFSECLNKATHPGNLREIVTRFQAWKAGLPGDDQQELTKMFVARLSELKGG